MRALKITASLLFSLVLLTVVAPPAQAAVRRIPITCGMVVTQDAVLYLTRNLTCPGTGVRVTDQGSRPHVVVDLRGHTLRGPGTEVMNTAGVYAGPWEFETTTVEVINGRLENWWVAVSGGWETRARNVALVRNWLGFTCHHKCLAATTSIARNAHFGPAKGDRGISSVTRSTFVDNSIGSYSPFGLTISGSRFFGNDLGVNAPHIRVTRSLFMKNDTAIEVYAYEDESACADLHKVIFVRNKLSLVGERCET